MEMMLMLEQFLEPSLIFRGGEFREPFGERLAGFVLEDLQSRFEPAHGQERFGEHFAFLPHLKRELLDRVLLHLEVDIWIKVFHDVTRI